MRVEQLYNPNDNELILWRAIKRITPGAGGGGAWGTITGTLSDQTDLNTALNSKIPDTGTAYKLLQYDVNGDIQETNDITDDAGVTSYNTITRRITDSSNDKSVDGEVRALTNVAVGDILQWNDGIDISDTKAVVLRATLTAGGTTGAQTINKISGSVNFAAAATTLVVTNSFVTTSSIVLVQVHGADVTAISARVTTAAGSFTITLNSAATAETKVSFIVFGTF